MALGCDVSEWFCYLAAQGVSKAFVTGDARTLPIRTESCDAVIALCQGGFGSLLGDPSLDPFNLVGDEAILREVWRVLRPGARCVVTGFNAYFQVRWLEPTDRFDAMTAANDESTEVVSQAGPVVPATLRTTCFTPRELVLLATAAGFARPQIFASRPGHYGAVPATIDVPELMLVATKPLRISAH